MDSYQRPLDDNGTLYASSQYQRVNPPTLTNLLMTDAGTDMNNARNSPPVTSSRQGCIQAMRQAGSKLKQEVLVTYYCLCDPRTSWASKIIPIMVSAAAVSVIYSILHA